jgi:hypothetical protein
LIQDLIFLNFLISEKIIDPNPILFCYPVVARLLIKI